MKNKPSGIHVATVNKKYKDKVYKCHLLRRSYREDGKVKSETIANLSMLPDEVLAVLKLSLAGENMIPARDISKAISTLPCGLWALRRAWEGSPGEKVVRLLFRRPARGRGRLNLYSLDDPRTRGGPARDCRK